LPCERPGGSKDPAPRLGDHALAVSGPFPFIGIL
jgi:hypothetical protein